MKDKLYFLNLGGRELVVGLGKLAQQANGSVTVRYGDTLVLVTAVMNKKPKEGGDFFPLTCDYEEKYYAAGKISGSRFIKREGRPSEEAVLSGRLIDRSIRPRFDHRMRNETQVVATILAFDGVNDPDVPALLGASLALSISNIPWNGPIAGIRVGKIGGKLVINPSYEERKGAELDILISGLAEKINMIEAGAKEISESGVAEALELGHQEIKNLIEFQKKIIAEHGVPKISVPLSEPSPELTGLMETKIAKKLEDTMYGKGDKTEKHAAKDAVEAEWKELVKEKLGDTVTTNSVEYVFHEKINEIVHRRMLERGERPDGRRHDELRTLAAEVAILPRVHGSGLFQRGETQILSVVTLAAPSAEQLFDTMEGEFKVRFMHHYNFPPYSTGEVGRIGGGGRREIGHGALAQRAMQAIIPPQDEFPYTIRLVSEALSSNGSTSMASVCASTLAMMDAGIPIKKPAAGIAMGLMTGSDGSYKVLTDIQGEEDHHGDMDFKVAGTHDGITALQMDVKIEGATIEMLKDAMAQAKEARTSILNVMTKSIAAPRAELSPTAPRIVTLKINPDKIRDLIGPGGKMINEIIDTTGAQIDVEDDGTVFVTAQNQEAGQKAVEWIKKITREIMPGELLEGRVSRIFNFGAMVEIGPKQEGLVHISELAPYRVNEVTDIVNVGDVIPVKVKNIDEQGRVNLSLKDVPGRYSDEDIEAGRARQSSFPGGLEDQIGRRGGSPTYRREDRGRGPRRR
ncbi:MAG: polyribonucleotide nucleotidyltransferase [Candidatus Sungbacteria bacterium]|nr:polyribonucleotide nucleotidyltransferase [Candidatus Sungbacteria bacterium]